MNIGSEFGLYRTIEEQFNFIRSNPRDQRGKNSMQWIAHYMDILREYSSKGKITVELGVNQVNSTFAFLASDCEVVNCVDVDFHVRPMKHHPGETRNVWFDHAFALAAEAGKQMNIFEQSSLTVRFEEIDLLFIDTSHRYRQCLDELTIHAPVTRKNIILHDTVLFGAELNRAIDEFLRENAEWYVEHVDKSQPGLTILGRR